MARDLQNTSYRFERIRPKIFYEHGLESNIKNKMEKDIARLEMIVNQEKFACWKSNWLECDHQTSKTFSGYSKIMAEETAKDRMAINWMRKLALIDLYCSEMHQYCEELRQKGKMIVYW
ncbi:uncharacterized protein LOC111622037 [Centruroides sculpturatus]|uniref:uncharacterized protein LOC111622037 n=1 Tax=Centruroides sculpturatus TaxID=218467 RepID=UPI000C6D2544|nr:uncharacterized protein LOC111622037 [Centruroides sculpturatus]XP_023220116.1 uncharacterized protein LOC111622037 [Centruroides sculpturatus]